MSEHDIQREILDYLTASGVFHYRQNTGRRGGVSYGKKGAPDIIAVIKGQYVGIEVKAPGGSLSPDQIAFKHALQGAGGVYIVAYDLRDVIAELI